MEQIFKIRLNDKTNFELKFERDGFTNFAGESYNMEVSVDNEFFKFNKSGRLLLVSELDEIMREFKKFIAGELEEESLVDDFYTIGLGFFFDASYKDDPAVDYAIVRIHVFGDFGGADDIYCLYFYREDATKLYDFLVKVQNS